MNLLNQSLQETVFTVVDLETTGFNASADRVVEISVRRFNALDGSVVEFDSLINPERRMSATALHGIGDNHVQKAPKFREVAPYVRSLLSNAVLATYNVDFDGRFLRAELQRAGHGQGTVPCVCLMHLKQILCGTPRCSLPDACRELGVPIEERWHLAANDVQAALGLLRCYLHLCQQKDLITFAHLRELGHGHTFLDTLTNSPLPEQPASECRGLSRRDWTEEQLIVPDAHALKIYFDAVVGILADVSVDEDELNYLSDLQQRLHLRPEQLGALHLRAYLCIATNCIGDDWLDPSEMTTLNRVAASFSKIGWAPGSVAS